MNELQYIDFDGDIRTAIYKLKILESVLGSDAILENQHNGEYAVLIEDNPQIPTKP